ncbi:hypothetical protein AX16_000684 [Volvariella volvacea WC 439]|nr:hypothetical protein AX16_000684 [Volvariella volvacea WC 439]
MPNLAAYLPNPPAVVSKLVGTVVGTQPPEETEALKRARTSLAQTQFCAVPSFNPDNQTWDRRLHHYEAFKAIHKFKDTLGKDAERFNAQVIKIFEDNTPRLSISRTEPPDTSYASHKTPEQSTKPSEGRLPTDDEIISNLFIDQKNPKREGHHGGISAVVYGLLNILAQTLDASPKSQDSDHNGTSPFLDLSPLYGPNPRDSPLRYQERTQQSPDGNGSNRREKLADGKIDEKQVYDKLPQTDALAHSRVAHAILFLFARNHNSLVDELKKDRTRWKANGMPEDDALFEAARVINCKLFINLVIQDFMKGLTGVPMTEKHFTLNLGAGERKDKFYRYKTSWALYQSPSLYPVPNEGEGNANTPRPATQDANNTADETGMAIMNILVRATETLVGRPRAGNAPDIAAIKDEVKRLIKRSRDTGYTFNEYRRSIGLKPLESFAQWNDSEIGRTAQRLYGDINKLDLFVGLQGEASVDRENKDGFGFGFTQTYALLVDLITTIRADPIHKEAIAINVEDFCKSKADAKQGSVLTDLILTHLEDWYTYNNIYAHYPFSLPKVTEEHLKREKSHTDYDTLSPLEATQPLDITNMTTISYIANLPQEYKTNYMPRLKKLTGGYGYLLGIDEVSHHNFDQMMTLYALLPNKRVLWENSAYFSHLVSKRVALKNKNNEIDIAKDVILPVCTQWVCDQIFGLPGVHDNNPWNVSGEDVNSITNIDKRQKFDEEMQKHVAKFATLFEHVFLRSRPKEALEVQNQAEKIANEYAELLEKGFKVTKVDVPYWWSWWEFLRRIFLEWWSGFPVKGHGTSESFLQRITRANGSAIGGFEQVFMKHLEQVAELEKRMTEVKSPEEKQKNKPKFVNEEEWSRKQRQNVEKNRIVANSLGLAVVASVNLASACIQVIDFYLRRSEYLQTLHELCVQEEDRWKESGRKTVMGYCREAQRLDQPFSLFRVYDPETITESWRLDYKDRAHEKEARDRATNERDQSKDDKTNAKDDKKSLSNQKEDGNSKGKQRENVSEETASPSASGSHTGKQPQTKVNALHATREKEDVPGELKDITLNRLVRLNFGQAHLSDYFKDPKNIDPSRTVHSVQGLGFHKCPGVSFVEEWKIMPEVRPHRI